MRRTLAELRMQEARALAEYAHRGQTRQTPDGPVPYIEHPVRVAERAQSWVTPDREALVGVIALLHDVVEDQSKRVEAWSGLPALGGIEQDFGPQAAATIRRLTNDPQVPYLDHVVAGLIDPYHVVVKLADFDDNALSLRPDHPRYDRLRAKYAPLLPHLRRAVRREDVRAMLKDPEATAKYLDARAAAAGFEL